MSWRYDETESAKKNKEFLDEANRRLQELADKQGFVTGSDINEILGLGRLDHCWEPDQIIEFTD